MLIYLFYKAIRTMHQKKEKSEEKNSMKYKQDNSLMYDIRHK